MTRLGPKGKGKSRPWARKKTDYKIPEHFTPIMGWIYKALLKIPYFGEVLAKIYVKGWNPINYGIIGIIGVLINMIILGSTLPHVHWIIANILAIFSAWLWNWANSVGPLCHHWGFKRQKDE